ncbi:MAG TPA: zinc metalloprotease HtpX [Gammaproteobacteria bacterium]|nr:zinc metalloprotease HtpX [Gammaproteobacteria bacterium]
MSDALSDFISTSPDWRKTLKQNNRRTIIVVGLFFLIYTGIGFLIDMVMVASRYPKATLPQIADALIHFQIFPIATFILLGVAFVSLFVAVLLADKLMLLGTDYHEITPSTAKTLQEKQLYNVVEEMKIAAGLRYMPKVYLIDADYMNAFASGFSEKSAMVAITRGLIEKLDRDELQAVMAHELSHIRHLDIKITITASLLANMTLMVLDVFFYNAIFSSRSSDGEDGRSRNTLTTILIILRYLLPVVNIIMLLYLSRSRELMADAGCVAITRDNQPLARALLKISGDHQQNKRAYTKQYQQTPHENVRREAYIFDPSQAGISSFNSVSDVFSTHPSLSARLKALGFETKDDK